MIVIDASVVAPLVLLDERPLSAAIEAALEEGPLGAPAHWPIETGNMLLMARRRGRIDAPAWEIAFGRLGGLRVAVVPPLDWRGWQRVSTLADEHRLTLYDAAYLDLAITSAATIATLDRALIAAARRVGLAMMTYA